jgi:hypothetical protein
MRFLFLLFTFGSAFTPLHSQSRRSCSPTLSSVNELSNVDEMCIENAALLCTRTDSVLDSAVEGCDIEEFEALKNQLTDQRSILATHLEKIEKLLARLDGQEVVLEDDSYIPG